MANGIDRYDPPGFMTDFEKISGQLDEWSLAVSGWFDEAIAKEKGELAGQDCQYYNQLHQPLPSGPTVEQAIVWNAFPGTLLRRFGEATAMEVAETMPPLSERDDGQGPFFGGPAWANLYYRPHHEYCEWRVERGEYGNITSVVFTSEPPEYWQALGGGELPDINGKAKYKVTGDHDLLVALYREYVSPKVKIDDLLCTEDLRDSNEPGNPIVYAKDSYNPYNRWNTTDGIMHLTHPANSLTAEIVLGGDGTVLRENEGRPVNNPDALICGTRYGGANRCSDPTIGATVHELAEIGCWVTLRNPVGLYMDHLDLTGITKPDGSPIDPGYFTVQRGDEKDGLIERAVFQVPAGEGCTVSDLRIGGRPIEYGGQLAKLMTVKLVGLAAEPGSFKNHPIPCVHKALIDSRNPAYLIQPRPVDRAPSEGEVVAFDYADMQAPPAPGSGPAPMTTAERQERLKTIAAKRPKFVPRPGR